jgi:hypothetical protein
MIMTTFSNELDTGLSHLLQSALSLANDRSEDNTHRREWSKRSYDSACAALSSRKRESSVTASWRLSDAFRVASRESAA